MSNVASEKAQNLNQEIRIFVSHTQNNDEKIEDQLYTHVLRGAELQPQNEDSLVKDNTGDNISNRSYVYEDLTVQYWAWKNIKCDYYGFCTGHQYLSFEEKLFSVDALGRISEEALNSELAKKKYGLSYANAKKVINKYDILVSEFEDIHRLNDVPGYKGVETVKDIYHLYENTLMSPKPSEILCKLLAADYQDLYPYLCKYLGGSKILMEPLFIMKREVFDKFCQMEFGVLQKLEERLKRDNFGEIRETAFRDIHSLLLAAFLLYQQDRKSVSIRHLQKVYFESIEDATPLKPYFEHNNIALMTMASNEYAPYLSVYLSSIIKNISDANNYDIIIFEKTISPDRKKLIQKQLEGLPNVSVRFYNMKAWMSDLHVFVSQPHFAMEAYYRILLPWVLPSYDKIIATDCDLITHKDFACLFAEEMEDYDLAAVKDDTYQAMLNGVFEADSEQEYAKDVLKLDRPYSYINTGVMLLNCKRIRSRIPYDTVLHFIQSQRFKFQEQDAINVLFQGNIKFLNHAWNYTVSGNPEVYRAKSYYLTESMVLESVDEPYIVHYYTHPKPWYFPDSVLADEWWENARKSPFYEELLTGLINYRVGDAHFKIYNIQERLGLNDHRTKERKFVDAIFPEGTRRRQSLKKLFPYGSLQRNLIKKAVCCVNPKYRKLNLQEKRAREEQSKYWTDSDDDNRISAEAVDQLKKELQEKKSKG